VDDRDAVICNGNIQGVDCQHGTGSKRISVQQRLKDELRERVDKFGHERKRERI
jgi:hypothetical protein